ADPTSRCHATARRQRRGRAAPPSARVTLWVALGVVVRWTSFPSMMLVVVIVVPFDLPASVASSSLERALGVFFVRVLDDGGVQSNGRQLLWGSGGVELIQEAARGG